MQGSSSLIGAMRRANEVIRRANGKSDLSLAAVQMLLLIAEKPGESVSWLAQESGLSISGAQRVLSALGKADRQGRPGPTLIEEVADPHRLNRNLLFLSENGRDLIVKVMYILNNNQQLSYDKMTASIFKDQVFNNGQRGARVIIGEYSPQQVATAKRSLKRKKIEVGRYLVAFPLQPARDMLEEIDQWIRDRSGFLRQLPEVGKPEGMAIADLPTKAEQFEFVLRFRSPK